MNSYQRFNFMKKSLNLCQWNITKFKALSKNLNKKNSSQIKRFNFMNKI